MATPDFRVGDFIGHATYKRGIFPTSLELYQRYLLGHDAPYCNLTHIYVVDNVMPSLAYPQLMTLAEQTAPKAKKELHDRNRILEKMQGDKPEYIWFRPTFTITPEMTNALWGYIDGVIGRETAYDAQQLIVILANRIKDMLGQQRKEEWTDHVWAIREHPDEYVCSTFGARCLRVMMWAGNMSFRDAFDGLHIAKTAPSHFAYSPVIKRIIP